MVRRRAHLTERANGRGGDDESLSLATEEDAAFACRLAEGLLDLGHGRGQFVTARGGHGDESGELHVGVAGDERLLTGQDVLVLLAVGEVVDLADAAFWAESVMASVFSLRICSSASLAASGCATRVRERRTPWAKMTGCKKFGATSWRGHSLIHSTVE